MQRRLIQGIMMIGLMLGAAIPAAAAVTTPAEARPLAQNEKPAIFGTTPTPVASLSSDGGSAMESQRPGEVISLMADANISDLRLAPPEQAQIGMQAASTVNITYLAAGTQNHLGDSCLAFPEQARPAIDAAGQIWASYYQSGIPISIEACWANLDPGVLGHTSALTYFRNFANAPVAGTWYPSALANSLANVDLDPSSPDISMAFSNSFLSSLYYGTDGFTPVNRYDFETIVLHEITHGLGFSGSMRVSSELGTWGFASSPDAYDRFTEDTTGISLINPAVYPNPSVALGMALESDGVYFNAPQANAANGGQRVKLYAPATWSSGSSYVHLDNIYNGTAHALMTYSLSLGESLHNPGAITDGMLRDIGWLAAVGGTPTPAPTATASPTYKITGKVVDGLGAPIPNVFFSFGQGTVASTNASGDYIITGLSPGTYKITPARSGYTFVPAARDVVIAAADADALDFVGMSASSSKAAIKGKITDDAGSALAGVTVSAGAGHTAVSDINGDYTLANLDPGVYILTPARTGYTFAPVSRQVSLGGTDVVGQNFKGAHVQVPTYSVSGQVLDSQNQPLSGVLLTEGSGHSTGTDSEGKYTLDGLAAGTYVLSPTKNGYTFAPVSLSITITSADVGGQNFVAKALPKGPYSISGKTTDNAGTPLASVLVRDEQGYSALSDASGHYTLVTLPAGSYSLSAIKSGYTFSATFENPLTISNANVTEANFIGNSAPSGAYSISGVVKDSRGTPLGGVTIRDYRGIAQAVTDSSGAYTLSNLPDGYYVLQALRGSEVFTPAWRTQRLPQGTSSQDFERVEQKIHVNTPDDGHDVNPGDGACTSEAGLCTLRAAVEEANARKGGDIVVLPAGTYALTQSPVGLLARTQAVELGGNLLIKDTLVIQGEGAATTIVDGKDIQSILEILPEPGEISLTLADVTLENGNGAGIINQAGGGALSLVRSVIRKNHAPGIWVDQFNVTLEKSQVVDNSAVDMIGGLDVNQGMTTILDSTVANNEGSGGGVRAGGGLVLLNSSIYNNRGVTQFGGLSVSGGGALVNSTVSGNTGREGGGIWTMGDLQIYSCTIAGNESLGTGGGDTNSGLGGGIYQYPGGDVINVRNSILSENKSASGAPDCFGTITSMGYNLVGDRSGCDFCADNGDQFGLDPGIGILEDNGGLTLTQNLNWGGWAIDAGNPGGCVDQNHFALNTDQRGSVRPVDGKKSGTAICDAGAFELQPVNAPYEISGKITDGQGLVIPNTTISLDNGIQTISDKDGMYRISNLEAGQYRVTATRNDYQFSPPLREVKLPPSREKVNFIGLSTVPGTFTISGTVVGVDCVGMCGVSIRLDNHEASVTDNQGAYAIRGVSAGLHVITPSKAGVIFTPLSITVDLRQDITEVNFFGKE